MENKDISNHDHEKMINLLFQQTLSGVFFMMLNEPVIWNDAVDKEKTLDYVFANQRVVKINKAMLAQYMMTEDEFLNKTPSELFAHDIKNGRKIWKEFFDKGQLHIDTDERRSDGTQMWIEGDYICLYDEKGRITGHFGVQNDITERKKTEDDLFASQKFTSDIIEHSGALVFVKDREGKYLLINGKWEEATGLKRENVLGKTDHEVFSKEFADQFRNNDLEVINKGETIQLEETLGMGEDKKYFISIKFPIRDESGNITGTCGMTTETTKYRKTQVNLLKLSLRHDTIIDTIPEIIVEVDKNKIYTWANKAGYEFFGNDVIGKEASYYFEGQQDTYNIVNPLFEGKDEVIYVESRQRRKDGKIRVLAWWCKVNKDSSGDFLSGISTARDITEEREAEIELNKRMQELSAVYSISSNLQKFTSVEELSVQLIKILEKYLKYDFCAFLTLDETDGTLRPFALSDQGKGSEFVKNDKEYVFSNRPGKGKGITGWVATHGQSLNIDDVTKDPRYYGLRNDIRSELCVPLKLEDKVIGVINVETHFASAYTESDLRILETVASSTSIAIKNSILYEEIKNEVNTRKIYAEELEAKVTELQIFNEITIGRELKMVELKKEVNELLKAAGKQEKYEI